MDRANWLTDNKAEVFQFNVIGAKNQRWQRLKNETFLKVYFTLSFYMKWFNNGVHHAIPFDA